MVGPQMTASEFCYIQMALTQSEDALEKGLIKTLTDMAYEYVEIKEECIF